MKKLFFILFIFLCGCYGTGISTERPTVADTAGTQEQPRPIIHKHNPVPVPVAAVPKEKTETTEEYIFWILFGIIGTTLFATLIILRDKKLAERIKKRDALAKHLKNHKAKHPG